MKTNDMKDSATTGLVPKLRFPEFRDEDGWQVKPLSQLATRTKRKNRDEKLVRVLTNSAEFGVIDQRDFFDKDIATQGNLESYFVVDVGSYVYNPRISSTAPVGPISKNRIGTGVMSPLYTVFKFKEEGDEFFEHYFKTTGWHAYMRRASSTGARHDRMAISGDDFMAMPLPVPTPKEQQKIADCLSSLDELIAAQGRKVEALKTHKKGLMQQLFPREGEAQPRLRFPEFRNAGEWEERNAGSLFGHRTTRGESGLPIYSVTMNDGMVRRDSLERKVDDIEDAAGNKKCLRNDIAYNMMRMWQVAMGVAPEDCLVSPAYVVLTPKKDAVPQFFQYLFKLSSMLALLTAHSRGLTKDRLRLYFDDFASMTFRCPGAKEQKRIADFLSSLDDCIAAQSKVLEAIKTHKKGLMQQLFPSAEAVEA